MRPRIPAVAPDIDDEAVFETNGKEGRGKRKYESKRLP